MLKTRNLNTLPTLATLWLALTEQCLKGKPATAVSSSQKHCTHPDLPLVCRSTEKLVLETDLPRNLMDVPPPLPKTANCRILLKKKKYSRVYIERGENMIYLWSDWQYPSRQKDILDLARFIFWHQMQSNDLWACSLHRRNALIEKKNQKILQHAPSQQYSSTAQWFLRSVNAFSPKKTEETEPFIPEGSGQTQIPHLQDGFNHKQTPKEKSDKSELWLTEYFFPTLAESHFRSALYIIKLNSIF